MAGESGFPYEGFTQWFADAVLAIAVIDKVRIAAESGRSDIALTAEEHTLLEAVSRNCAGRYSTLQKIAALSPMSFYPVLSPDEVQVIWNVLTGHIAADKRYMALRSSLTTFLATRPSVEYLLFCMFGCLGPALAPKELWGCALPQTTV